MHLELPSRLSGIALEVDNHMSRATNMSLREMVEEVTHQQIRQINDNTTEHIHYPQISKRWVRRFLDHHPDLDTIIGVSIDAA